MCNDMCFSWLATSFTSLLLFIFVAAVLLLSFQTSTLPLPWCRRSNSRVLLIVLLPNSIQLTLLEVQRSFDYRVLGEAYSRMQQEDKSRSDPLERGNNTILWRSHKGDNDDIVTMSENSTLAPKQFPAAILQQSSTSKQMSLQISTTLVLMFCLAPLATEAFAPGITVDNPWRRTRGGQHHSKPVAQRQYSAPQTVLLRPPETCYEILAGTVRASRRTVPFRFFASQSAEDNVDDDDEDDDDTNEGRMRKRDRIKDWFSTSSSSSSSEDATRSRIKSRFDNLFSGMPSLGEILADQPNDEQGDTDASTGKASRKVPKKDPLWFEEEKRRIVDR